MNFSTSQVCDLSGATERIVQLWDERKVVQPDSKDGHRRYYNPEQVLRICVLRELRRKGVSLQKLRKVNRALAKAVESPVMWFATDGKTAQHYSDPFSLAAYLCHAKSPMLVVDVEWHRQKIEDLMDRLRTKARPAAV